MRLKRNDMIDMPIMFDKVETYLFSGLLQRPYDDRYYQEIGINKADLTKRVREFIFQHEKVVGKGNKMHYEYDIIENVHKSGKPSFSFKGDFFKDYYATRVDFQGYNRFVAKIIGNPTRFQRKDYEEKGIINTEKDTKYRIHDDNYLYPDLLKEPIEYEEFMNANRRFFAKSKKIGEYLTDYVLTSDEERRGIMELNPNALYKSCHYLGSYRYILESEGRWEDLTASWNDPEQRRQLNELFEGGMFRRETCHYIEINQDLLLPKNISKEVMHEIVKFFTSKEGRDYYGKNGIGKLKTNDNREYDGCQVIIHLPKGYGEYKIYGKTKYTIRREICLKKEDIIGKFGNKNINNIKGNYESFIKNVVNPAFEMIDLKGIICNEIEIKEYLPKLIISKSKSMDDKEKIFWRKVLSNSLLKKEDIPDYLINLVRCHWKYDRNLKRSKRMYELKPELKEKYGVYI